MHIFCLISESEMAKLLFSFPKFGVVIQLIYVSLFNKNKNAYHTFIISSLNTPANKTILPFSTVTKNEGPTKQFQSAPTQTLSLHDNI